MSCSSPSGPLGGHKVTAAHQQDEQIFPGFFSLTSHLRKSDRISRRAEDAQTARSLMRETCCDNLV